SILHSVSALAYAVNTKSCPGDGLVSPGDSGSICLALTDSDQSACQQPITLSRRFISFPSQLLGSAPTSQTVVLTNTDPSGSTLNNLSLEFLPNGFSDFNGLASFTEHDNCAPSLGTLFSLLPQQGCSITISFAPQQSCPWIGPSGTPAPSFCPSALTAKLTVN